jgi:regulator of RNase E activity RraA
MNGVVVFPVDLTDYVIDEAGKVTKRESDQFNWVNSDDFSLEEMIKKG